MRKPVMAGNWKMYKTAAETTAFFEKFSPAVANAAHAEVVICPPFVDLPAAVDAARGTAIGIGGQDVFWLREGAYTGEVSAPMLAAVGCGWVIVGHSERRQYFAETDETVLKKTQAALDAGLTPIVCVGERLEQRESGDTARPPHRKSPPPRTVSCAPRSPTASEPRLRRRAAFSTAAA
jgi:triosephosphate isomerase